MAIAESHHRSNPLSVSVLILTKDEEVNLPDCLACVNWSDDVVILDSYSNDKTESIARSNGCRFIQRRFDDYARQRNYGLNQIEYKNPWLLMIDADERVTEHLRIEIENTLKQVPDDVHLFFVRRKDYFLDKWIKRSSGYPTWFGRLIRVGKVRVERAINEEYHAQGRTDYFNAHLSHYPFNKGMHHWFRKHNRYSSMEVELMNAGGPSKIKMANLVHGDPLIRRKEIKKIVYKLPFRPVLVFLALYILRGGFLDGYAGLKFCKLRYIYEYMIIIKSIDSNHREKMGRF